MKFKFHFQIFSVFQRSVAKLQFNPLLNHIRNGEKLKWTKLWTQQIKFEKLPKLNLTPAAKLIITGTGAFGLALRCHGFNVACSGRMAGKLRGELHFH